MTEREVQAQLHPHTGQVEVGAGDMTLDALRKGIANTKALKRAVLALKTIQLENNLQGAVAKNALEDIKALIDPPRFTYDHAGPDY